MVEIFFSCLSQQTKDKRQEYNNLKKWRLLNGTPTTNVPVHAWKHIHTYNRASLSLFDSVHLHRNIHSCSLSKSEEEKKKHRDKVRRGMRNILLQLRCLDVISSSWLNLNLIQWKSCHIWNLLHVTASHTRLKMDFAVSKRNFDLPKFRFFLPFSLILSWQVFHIVISFSAKIKSLSMRYLTWKLIKCCLFSRADGGWQHF